MSRDYFITRVLSNSTVQNSDRIIMGLQKDVANPAGSGAGATVSVQITFSKALPPNFAVMCGMQQDATWWYDTIVADGFTVHLAPRLAANTLAAGTFDVLVLG